MTKKGEGKERKNAFVQSSLLMLKIKEKKKEKKDTENTRGGGIKRRKKKDLITFLVLRWLMAAKEVEKLPSRFNFVMATPKRKNNNNKLLNAHL